MMNNIKRFDEYMHPISINESNKDILRYFYDTEFIENGETILLLSIGIVCEDGRELYLENLDAIPHKESASDWVKENVYPYLALFNDDLSKAKTHKEIASEIKSFVKENPIPELWGYYSSYDHVVLAQLFGTMMDLPNHFPKFTNDIKQLQTIFGTDIPEMDTTKYKNHNALDDARWTMEAFQEMNSKSTTNQE